MKHETDVLADQIRTVSRQRLPSVERFRLLTRMDYAQHAIKNIA